MDILEKMDAGIFAHPEVWREAKAEIERLRAIIRVNCLRWGGTHADADRLINGTESPRGRAD